MSFLCVAVVLCASLKTWAIFVRREVTGPSSGISTAFEDCLADDARVDLVVRVVEEVDVRGARVDVRPTMLTRSLGECLVART